MTGINISAHQIMKRQEMELKCVTTAGILNWTLAPALSSLSSPEGSECSWDEDQDKDFQSLMDQNGIIGLEEHQETGGLGMVEELLWEVKTPEPEPGPPSAVEEMSYHLSELLDSEPLSQATGDDCKPQAQREEQRTDDEKSAFDWTDEEAWSQPIEGLGSFSERDTSNVKSTCEDDQRFMDLGHPISEEKAPTIDWSDEVTEFSKSSHVLRIPKYTEQRELKTTDEQFLPVSLCSIGFPCIELRNKANTDPLSEIVPESAFTMHQSPVPQTSHVGRSNEEQAKISPQSPQRITRLGKTFQDDAREEKLERRLNSPHHNLQPLTPSPRKTNPASCNDQVSIPARGVLKVTASHSECSPPYQTSGGANPRHFKTSCTDPEDIRKGQLSHTLPDFSKVESRVHFQKRSKYIPPKSRRALHNHTSHQDLPVVFKSPAEIVREVLLSSSHDAPGGSSSSRTHGRLQTTIPEEFRCPQQASTLMQQLQEDYNRLLTKYAEAENTIDRLRLEAKVGLYSEPPKPSTAIQSGVIQEGSKVMTLSFPQAQRAEFGPGYAHLTQQKELTGNSRKPSPRPASVSSVRSVTADHLTETLSKQTEGFQLQIDFFETLLKMGKLTACEQVKGVSTLTEGQESLERAYMDARAEYQLLRHATFDPDRDLEGQIFRSGMRLEELKEWLEQEELKPSASEAAIFRGFRSAPSDALTSSVLETDPIPESTCSMVHPEACVCVEVSSFIGESDADREDQIKPVLFQSFHDQSKHVEKDFDELTDCYESGKKPTRILDQAVAVKSCDLLDTALPGIKHVIEGITLKTGKIESAQWQPAADCIPPFGTTVRSQVCGSMETYSEACCHERLNRERKPSGNRTASKSLTSLTQSLEPRSKSLKPKAKTLREASLDGIVSPETDSGFLGSESSQQTAELPCPLQQSTAVRPSDPSLDDRPESALPPGHPFITSSSLSEASFSSPGKCLDEKTNPSRKKYSYSTLSSSISPLHWPRSTLRPWSSDLISQSQHESEEVKTQNCKKRHTANQETHPQRSPSLQFPYSSVQLTNHQNALQSLHEEVNRLKERLEEGLRLPNLDESVKSENSRAQLLTSTPKRVDSRSSEKRRMQTKTNLSGGNSPERTLRRRSVSVPRRRPDADLASDPEHVHSDPRPSTSRLIAVSPVKSRGRKHHKEEFSTGRSSDGDDSEPYRRTESCCPHCRAESTSPSIRPPRSRSSPHLMQASCSFCPMCGVKQTTQTSFLQVNQAQASSSRGRQPIRSLQRDRGGTTVPVAPPPPPPPVQRAIPVVSFVPVYPSTLYVCNPVTPQDFSQPLKISRSSSREEKSEVRGNHRRSLSMDPKQECVKRSLSRAITAARHMKQVSHRMAHSLSESFSC